jgi:transcriptional regulator with PAS, ATPase and Fis domain
MPDTKKSIQDRVVVLIAPKATDTARKSYEAVGAVVTEISELYQIAKEQRVDLVIVDRNRNDMTRAVATRIRRRNGLTEIWRVVDDELDVEGDGDHIDGGIRSDLNVDGLAEKVRHILHGQDLLAKFNIVGRSAKMKVVAETIDRIAPTDIAVLVVGQSGTGKELVAEAIHENSTRKGKAFVEVNCGALAEGVLESELFGHEKGAFTGSVGKREGLFHRANGGTIFLDEIGEMRPETQVKLLRVLEDGTYYPVGSSTPQHTDTRVISATNRDLIEAIEEREFREDLYFRIGVVKIILPPLLERRTDIQPLLQHFWRKHNLDVSDSALDRLMRFDWPGNVRQLRNFAERMIALKQQGLAEMGDVDHFIAEQHSKATHLPVTTGKTVEEAGQELIYRAILSLGNEIRMLRDLITSHLPGESTASNDEPYHATTDDDMSMERMEHDLIVRALEDSGGNRKKAAQRLGIGERTLYRKLKKYGLT